MSSKSVNTKLPTSFGYRNPLRVSTVFSHHAKGKGEALVASEKLIQERNPFLEPKTTRKTALNTEIKETVAILRNFFCIPCVLQFPLGLLKILCLKCIFKI
ncbi:hypothetical protein AVEN_197148-1 [Araneus ventricosus]|uniref:Uncharacterized protein n=1 Tax=Araneus ventricosus TaxID=182803 RepID=A0A4Y2C2L4_ARAVE|nr:hypothetical protein AVEN_197148-1 [Araneus ventricosus]